MNFNLLLEAYKPLVPICLIADPSCSPRFSRANQLNVGETSQFEQLPSY